MYQQHSSSNTKQQASVSSKQSKREIQHKKVENEKRDQFLTPLKTERRRMNYINHTPVNRTPPVCRTPTNRHPHPPGWDKITWAPKVCHKAAVRRMDFGEIATAAH